MSNERLLELGIPRRSFLKKTATAAFVAPVVVSFGLDGIAEADPGSVANQTAPNQTCPNQFFGNQLITGVTHDVEAGIDLLLRGTFAGQIDFGIAQDLSHQLLLAGLLATAGRTVDACACLDQLTQRINEAEEHLTKIPPLFAQLGAIVANLAVVLGCSSCMRRRRD